MKNSKSRSLSLVAIALMAITTVWTALVAAQVPPQNTVAPNLNLVRRVQCVAAAYRIASTPSPLTPGMARMQGVTEAQFLSAFAGAGECVGLDAQSALVLLRAQQATLVVGGATGTGIGLPTLPTVPTVPAIAPSDAGVAITADVPGITVVPPVTFVLAPADAGTAAAVVPTPDAAVVSPTAASRCRGHGCGHG